MAVYAPSRDDETTVDETADNDFVMPDDLVVTSNNKVKEYKNPFNMAHFERNILGKVDKNDRQLQ